MDSMQYAELGNILFSVRAKATNLKHILSQLSYFIKNYSCRKILRTSEDKCNSFGFFPRLLFRGVHDFPHEFHINDL